MANLQDRPKSIYSELKQRSQGQWLSIFGTIPGLSDAVAVCGKHVLCPISGHAESFRFFSRGSKKGGSTADCGAAVCSCGSYSDGIAVIKAVTGWSDAAVIRHLKDYHGMSSNSKPYVAPTMKKVEVPKVAPRVTEAETLATIKGLLEKAQKITPETVSSQVPYLTDTRMISPETLKDVRDVGLIPALPYYDTERVDTANGPVMRPVKKGTFPAMIGIMRNKSGHPVSAHRTWISQDRMEKAPVPRAKKLTASYDASASTIRLFPLGDGDTLGLAEGIETSFSARELCRKGYFPDLKEIPVWATYSEANMRYFEIPVTRAEPEGISRIKRLVLFADNDANGVGMKAATILKERMATERPNLIVDIYCPPEEGTDWNDVLMDFKCLEV